MGCWWIWCLLQNGTRVDSFSQCGLKKEKSRISGLLYASNGGSGEFPLMFIGRFWKPRPFDKNSGREHGLDHHANAKTLMTQALFIECLYQFNSYIAFTPRWKAILLLDNFSAYDEGTAIPLFSNVELSFLPTNTISRIQLMDAGTIAPLKDAPRKRYLYRIFENIEANEKYMYNVDLLSAMKWLKEKWMKLSTTNILIVGHTVSRTTLPKLSKIYKWRQTWRTW